ncbi:MAG TPA: class I SAM-dependent methyltransferase [Saprospiraceae bacterium]|nr:class I SAM-dependent methyltransferase [Saprospiraceae bacterium]HND90064.1 class I SAM-dependent methyltransferase [Saprospiraceae bacterium]
MQNPTLPTAEWFEQWFDSPYYHLLYQQRDDIEAQGMVRHFAQALDLPAGARVLDLACGKGRHSRFLAELGYDVTGLDISPQSIDFARQYEHEHLAFYQHDMRLPFRINYFDAVLNMFTSFGYFEHDREHVKTLQQVGKALRPGGHFLLDYFNAEWVRAHLVAEDVRVAGGIEFRQKRRIEAGHVYKTIDFQADGRVYTFTERVRLFSLGDFERMFAAAGLRVQRTYGDYDLAAFVPDASPRLIVTAVREF